MRWFMCSSPGPALPRFTLFLYLTVSLEDFGALLRASLRASASVMWFAPAALLLSAVNPGAAAVGLLVIANTIRLLVSRIALRTFGPSRRRKAQGSRARLFHLAEGQRGLFSRERSR